MKPHQLAICGRAGAEEDSKSALMQTQLCDIPGSHKDDWFKFIPSAASYLTDIEAYLYGIENLCFLPLFSHTELTQ